MLDEHKDEVYVFWSSMKVGIGKGDKENGREGKGKHGNGMVVGP